MIVPYSGTRHGCTEYIKESLEENVRAITLGTMTSLNRPFIYLVLYGKQ